MLKVHDQFLAMAPFFVLVAAALALAVHASPRLRLGWRSLAIGAALAGGWTLFAVFGPHLFGIDRAAEEKIVAAGDPSALKDKYGVHPLADLALMALGASLVCLLAVRGVSARRSRLGEQGEEHGVADLPAGDPEPDHGLRRGAPPGGPRGEPAVHHDRADADPAEQRDRGPIREST
jgi:hypothetical protein